MKRRQFDFSNYHNNNFINKLTNINNFHFVTLKIFVEKSKYKKDLKTIDQNRISVEITEKWIYVVTIRIMNMP